MRTLPSAILLAVVLWSSASRSRADAPAADVPPSDLTSQGRRVIAGTLGGFYTNDHSMGLGALYRWGLYASPSFTYFLRKGLGIGTSMDVEYKVGNGGPVGIVNEMAFGFGVHLIYDVRIGERLSMLLWPSVSYRFAREQDQYTTGTYGYTSRLRQEMDYPRVGLSLPFVYHVSSAVGLGLGPYFYSEFAIHRESNPQVAEASSHRESLGVTSTIIASF